MHPTGSRPGRAAVLGLTILLGVLSVRTAPAQAAAERAPVRGVVRGSDDRPIEGANVFVIETLEGIVTGQDGRFAFVVTVGGPVTLVVRRLGYGEVRRRIAPEERDSVIMSLAATTATLATVTVRAGEYKASEERGATLTPLEVVTTPGTAADVNRAIQALPGVQAVDEGTGLFVRGGDFTETKVFLNDAVMLNPVQLLSPSGTFVGTVDPFLLDGIFFSSGGFGARYGDALSAVVALRTLGRASNTQLTAGAGLATVAASAAANPSSSLGLRAAANRFDLDPVLAVNGSPQDFDPAPHGFDASASVIWNYRGTGEVKAFAIRQTSGLGLGVDDASFSGDFTLDLASDLAVVSWKDLVGSLRPTASLSKTTLDRTEDYGAFRLRTRLRQRQLFAQQEWSLGAALTLRSGGELEHASAEYLGTIPEAGDDLSPGARTRVIGAGRNGDRVGGFVETDWRADSRTRIVSGVRGDRSSLTRRVTVDPRVSAAYSLFSGATLTAAVGTYHQVPDPLDHEDALAADDDRLPPMRAVQGVIGLQIGSDVSMVRVEVYRKRYDDLALRTRDYAVVSGGTGSARGVDLFVKGGLPLGARVRYAMSHVDAERTDPHSGIVARAPFDIRFSHTLVAERQIGVHWSLATAYRVATGRPYTPVTGATFDDDRGVYTPKYGAPMSERLPAFRRLDVSVAWLGRITPAWQTVFYAALTNVLDRTNVQSYRYSPDYSRRMPVRSIFNRSIYFGTTITRLTE